MFYLIWLIIGIIAFLITLYVHTHTYFVDDIYDFNHNNRNINEKVKVPLYMLIIAILSVFIPIFNIAIFIVGIISYALAVSEDEIEMKIDWIDKVMKFLNKRVI